MGIYKLQEVVSKRDISEFLELSNRINAGNPNWVRPLDADIKSIFDPKKNELFIGGEAIRWILKDEKGEVIGRIAAFYNTELANNNEQPTGGCGFFECPNDQQAANILFDAAKDWLRERGMEAMDGPINFGDRNSWWGVLVKGFTQPVYGMPYNPPYYKDLFEAYGFQNYFDQHCYLRDLRPNCLSESTYQRAERLNNTPGYLFKHIEKKNLAKYADDFMEVYNKGWVKFTGVKPIDRHHAQKLMKMLKPIIDEKLMYFAYFEDKPIGFFIMVPDLNRITRHFNGKFGLWQKLELLYRLNFTKEADRAVGLIFGVVPEYQGKGIESGMIRRFEDAVNEPGFKYKTLEMTWIGDFNPVMMRVAEQQVCAERFKMHTTYRYLFDRQKEFTRAPKLGRVKPAQKDISNQ